MLHGSATTPHAIRAAIQRSTAPLKELAGRYSLNRLSRRELDRSVSSDVVVFAQRLYEKIAASGRSPIADVVNAAHWNLAALTWM